MTTHQIAVTSDVPNSTPKRAPAYGSVRMMSDSAVEKSPF
jgi:hypothetical protein